MKIRSKRPGPLLVADVKLRLAPGEVIEVAQPSRHLERALAAGWVEQVDAATPLGIFAEPEPPVALPTDYERLSASEAIEYIEDEEDAGRLEQILASEKRKTVLEALRRKLQEVTAGAGG